MAKTDNELLNSINDHMANVASGIGSAGFSNEDRREFSESINKLAAHIRAGNIGGGGEGAADVGSSGSDYSETKIFQRVIEGSENFISSLGSAEKQIVEFGSFISTVQNEFFSRYYNSMFEQTARLVSGREALDNFVDALNDASGALRQGIGSVDEWIGTTIRNFDAIFNEGTVISYENTLKAIQDNMSDGGLAFAMMGLRAQEFGEFINNQRSALDRTYIDNSLGFEEQNSLILTMVEELRGMNIDAVSQEMTLRNETLKRFKLLDAIKRNTGQTVEELMKSNKEDIMSLQQALASGSLSKEQYDAFIALENITNQMPDQIKNLILGSALYGHAGIVADSTQDKLLASSVEQITSALKANPNMTNQQMVELVERSTRGMTDILATLNPNVYRDGGGDITLFAQLQKFLGSVEKMDLENRTSQDLTASGITNSLKDWFSNTIEPALTIFGAVFGSLSLLNLTVNGNTLAVVSNTVALAKMTGLLISGKFMGPLTPGQVLTKGAAKATSGLLLLAVATDVITSFIDGITVTDDERSKWGKKALTGLGTWIGAFLSDFLPSLLGIVAGGLLAVVAVAVGGTGLLAASLIGGIGYFAVQILDYIFPGVKDALVEWSVGVADFIGNFIENFSFSNIFNSIKDYFIGIKDTLVEKVLGIFDSISDGIETVWDSLFGNEGDDAMASYNRRRRNTFTQNMGTTDIASSSAMNIDRNVEKYENVIREAAEANPVVVPEELRDLLDQTKLGNENSQEMIQVLRDIRVRTGKQAPVYSTTTGDE